MVEFIKVCNKNEIEDGKGKVVDVNGKNIAVMNNGGEILAIDNTCAHMHGPLGDGECKEGKVRCPWHMWEYDLKTGKCETDENIKLNTFEVKIEGEDVLVHPEPKGE
jgi:nitrite reductase/ring-hydroxylating ferredoxin subunit